jgi:23S rRNA (cytosine1962-C5)-methyltransferase
MTGSRPPRRALFRMSLPVVLLKPGEADRIVAGHPWVYASSILRLTTPAGDGDVVQVKDHRQRFLGVGLFNSKSKIAVRVLSHERDDLDERFFRSRLEAAFALRRRWMPGADACRLVNAEADFLSGLIVDRYRDVLVVQTSSLGMDRRKAMITKLLLELTGARAIIERNDAASRKFEGLGEVQGVLHGSDPGPVDIRINSIDFTVDLNEGHKTGMYLDQQVNYQAVAGLAKDALVLDCFTFLGGFALHAARAGAKQVHALDQSEAAVTAAKRGAEHNGLASKVTFEAANVFDWLKGRTVTRPHEKLIAPYDLIILDPPSFTRNRASVEDALRGYKEIHLRALKLLKPGGILATFCCSHHVDAKLFEDVALSAAYDTRRVLRRVAVYTQSPDHPVLPAVPETEYLKGAAYQVAA